MPHWAVLVWQGYPARPRQKTWLRSRTHNWVAQRMLHRYKPKPCLRGSNTSFANPRPIKHCSVYRKQIVVLVAESHELNLTSVFKAQLIACMNTRRHELSMQTHVARAPAKSGLGVSPESLIPPETGSWGIHPL